MKLKEFESGEAMKELRDDFLARPVHTPSSLWYQDVMQNIRAGNRPETVRFPSLEQVAWRVAAVAAVLAITVSVAGLVSKSSASELAWDIAVSKTSCEWLLAMKE